MHEFQTIGTGLLVILSRERTWNMGHGTWDTGHAGTVAQRLEVLGTLYSRSFKGKEGKGNNTGLSGSAES